jgi:hypothetical protein
MAQWPTLPVAMCTTCAQRCDWGGTLDTDADVFAKIRQHMGSTPVGVGF